jgi:apolipoprotein N-acyltransferase
LLALATPPAVLPLAEFLVVPGLMAWFAVATAARRPYLESYVLGCVHMAWFSWSLRHILVWPYVGVMLVGGLYFVLGTLLVRATAQRWAPLGFAVAVAGSFWLRANMPEIYYPHGQPCHCLWQWPTLLGAVSLGGEPLANGLLAALAAALVGVWRSWRLAVPSWSSAWLVLLLAAAAAVVATVSGHVVHWTAAAFQAFARGESVVLAPAVRIAAVEPGLHPSDPFDGLSLAQARARYRELFVERLVAPTHEALRDSPPRDLVVWPETSVAHIFDVADIMAGRAQLRLAPFPAASTRLLFGAVVADGDTAAAVLETLPEGRVVGHQEKRCLVPGGEFLPLLAWLPDWLAAAARDAFAAALGGKPPNCKPGALRAPLQTSAGVPFGTLICYDNAFPGPASDQVAAGARFLCVLSNEAWYRGGGELTQLVAMTVCRALETATPIVRCTTDGWSVVVGADGRIEAELPLEPAPHPAARILRADVTPASGRLPPLAWLRAVAGPVAAVWLCLGLAHAAFRWVRLRGARTASIAVRGTGVAGPARGSGS